MKNGRRNRWQFWEARAEVKNWTLAELVETVSQLGWSQTNIEHAAMLELAARCKGMLGADEVQPEEEAG